ncbi:hypothetical protein Ahy_A03g014393 isoform A [Arachis hypogaea]|uniref:Protein LIKE COV n=1 Tax=Arachis hypogaea TaxID=3818 RepID=A0A445DXN0_ARAHY|nr:hypothetical protein Ahy_A03g014393 isoform A [Arachis hypogaea]
MARVCSGLGFVTSITFIFLIGVFMSSWLGASVLGLGEWFIKRMPLVRHIYNASKQISAAISPDQNTQAFKEVAIIRHPRIGEYAFGFITSSVVLQNYAGDEELCCVYVPTNHLYIGDIFLINTRDVIRPNLSVREGIEIVVSGGMSMPQILSTLDSRVPLDSSVKAQRILRGLSLFYYPPCSILSTSATAFVITHHHITPLPPCSPRIVEDRCRRSSSQRLLLQLSAPRFCCCCPI